MNPRRLHSATILSMVTTSAGMRGIARWQPWEPPIGTPILRVPCRSTSTAARTGHTFEVMQKMTDDPVTTLRDVRGAGRSASSTPSRSTSRARASTTPTTAPSAATASSSARPRTGADKHDAKQAEKTADDGQGRRPRVTADSRLQEGGLEARRRRSRTSRAGSARTSALLLGVGDGAGRRRRRAASRRRSGLRTAVGGAAAGRRAPNEAEQRRAAHVGLQRLRARSRRPSGRRMNAERADSTRDFIALRIFCWRRARVRSFSVGLQSLWRVRASASACLPSMCVRARASGAACSRRS